MKLLRETTITVRDQDLKLKVPDALSVLQFDEAFQAAEKAHDRYQLSLEFLRGTLEDVEEYPIAVVVEIATKLAYYVYLGDTQKKPETTP